MWRRHTRKKVKKFKFSFSVHKKSVDFTSRLLAGSAVDDFNWTHHSSHACRVIEVHK